MTLVLPTGNVVLLKCEYVSDNAPVDITLYLTIGFTDEMSLGHFSIGVLRFSAHPSSINLLIDLSLQLFPVDLLVELYYPLKNFIVKPFNIARAPYATYVSSLLIEKIYKLYLSQFK